MRLVLYFGILALLLACNPDRPVAPSSYTIFSPNKELKVVFSPNSQGELSYSLLGNSASDTVYTIFIDSSSLGVELEKLGTISRDFTIEGATNSSNTERYDLPWGEVASVEAGYEELQLSLKHAPSGLSFTVEARLFDDGLGLRYTFYKAPNREVIGGDTLRILEELTHFNIVGDPLVNWGPGDWNSYENRLELTKLSGIDATKYDNRKERISRVVPHNAIMTPATMRLDNGVHLSIHEANLLNYPEMTLQLMGDGTALRSTLAGTARRSAKAVVALPFSTPWRTIAVERRAIDLLDNHLVLNLNPANELGLVSWFQPMTYAGVWWEMFLGKGTWDFASGQTAAGKAVRGKTQHAANTENVKRYIDFCADNDIGGLLVEGWNTGWEVWIDSIKRKDAFDFVTPYPDYDLQEVVDYGRSKGVAIVMHHETSAVPERYEQQMDTAFALMKALGLHVVKTGYVGNVLPKGEYHHGQYMVNHYRKVLQTAATYEVAINAHEPIKPTGERRTLPNAISREGARGMEYNAFGDYTQVNQPSHLPSLVYTRCLAGPFDYTPGIFNLSMKPYKGPKDEVLSTLGGQLGTYVVIYAPIQMLADLPEHYLASAFPKVTATVKGNAVDSLGLLGDVQKKIRQSMYHPAMEYLRHMATNWDATYPLAGELGEYAVVARKVRGENRYFIGGIAGEQDQPVQLSLDFLPEGPFYELTLYRDADDAHFRKNKQALKIEKRSVSKGDTLSLLMKQGGGFGAELTPK